jgi:stage II sporulation protein AA (anti-sigma F factor antagonist)
LEIEVTREGEDVVVRPHGEIDVQTAPALRHAMDQAVESAKGDLVVDLEGVGFIDSSGLGVLLGRYRRMPQGRAMAIRRPRPHVLALLTLAGVPGLMRVEAPPESGAGEHAGRGA